MKIYALIDKATWTIVRHTAWTKKACYVWYIDNFLHLDDAETLGLDNLEQVKKTLPPTLDAWINEADMEIIEIPVPPQ